MVPSQQEGKEKADEMSEGGNGRRVWKRYRFRFPVAGVVAFHQELDAHAGFGVAQALAPLEGRDVTPPL